VGVDHEWPVRRWLARSKAAGWSLVAVPLSRAAEAAPWGPSPLVAGSSGGDAGGMAGPCIVVGVDGSAAAHEALRWAVELGEALGGEVVAVHGVGLLEEVHDPDEPDSTWRAGVRDLVERGWCARLAGASCPHRVVVRDGPAVDVLLGVAADECADLVVVGCRDIGTANPALTLGSTSLHVLQAARVPVLVVPVREEGIPVAGELALRRVLVGVDRSEPSLAALELAADLAETLGGSLSVLEVTAVVVS
jgi:nucleotide-binding universal stress UspA family protein